MANLIQIPVPFKRLNLQLLLRILYMYNHISYTYIEKTLHLYEQTELSLSFSTLAYQIYLFSQNHRIFNYLVADPQ